MALAILEEAAARSRHIVQPQTRGIVLALAYLAHVSNARERYHFDAFWRSLRNDDAKVRRAYVNASLNGIYGMLNRNREAEVMSAFEREATEMFGPLEGCSRQPLG